MNRTDYYYVYGLERFCLEKLNCHEEDLKRLNEIYSVLAESANVNLSEPKNDLNKMLYETYKKISVAVANSMKDLTNEDELEVLIHNDFKYYKMEESLKSDLLKKAEEIENSEPNCSDLSKPRFNNYIDDYIVYEFDFDNKIKDIRDFIIQDLIQRNLIKLGEEINKK